MADKTGIEWTDATWNPTTGCDQVSPGCDNCYALTLAKRLKAMGSPRYQLDGNPATSGPGFGFTMHPDALDQPLRWTKPRRIFVNSMSDLFHSDMSTEFLARVFAVMAAARQHTFQVLTKRPGRMRSLLTNPDFVDAWQAQIVALDRPVITSWPIPNVWLGTSVEDQKRADLRIPALLDTPAAVRFLSMEPLLGPVDILPYLPDTSPMPGPPWSETVDWVIVGGESGPGARPMHPDWARSLRDQCTAAGVAFHLKQWGRWAPRDLAGATTTTGVWLYADGSTSTGVLSDPRHPDPRAAMFPVGKKAAGRMLDGRTWDQFPKAVIA